MKSRSPEVCPVCGEDVPPNSSACPECGADERAGWNEEAAYLDGLDLPSSTADADDGESYEAFMEREFGVVPWKKRVVTILGILMILVMAVYLFKFF